MLAAGMLTLFAAAIAVRRRGFDSRSPPPWRAAIVISLMNFENSLPRAWSVAAFLRLIVAHFEWPDMVSERRDAHALAAASFSARAAAITFSASSRGTSS